MDFSGPAAADYRNVTELNTAFLQILRGRHTGRPLRRQLPHDLQETAARLRDDELRYLAAAPFLLMSFRERDEELWHTLLSEPAETDLLAAMSAAGETDRLTAAGLGFLWQLAYRNPYATRLVSGAALDWCERLAEITLLRLLQNAAGHTDLLGLRSAGRYDVWRKLLDDGVSVDDRLREAAHLSVLQAMLTTGATLGRQRLRAAACSATTPALGIAEKPRRG